MWTGGDLRCGRGGKSTNESREGSDCSVPEWTREEFQAGREESVLEKNYEVSPQDPRETHESSKRQQLEARIH